MNKIVSVIVLPRLYHRQLGVICALPVFLSTFEIGQVYLSHYLALSSCAPVPSVLSPARACNARPALRLTAFRAGRSGAAALLGWLSGDHARDPGQVRDEQEGGGLHRHPPAPVRGVNVLDGRVDMSM